MKSTIDDLAIFGGEPLFARKLHVGRPNIGDRKRIHERLDEILDRNWLTNSGPFEKAFEKRITELTGTRHCIATCNGTIALELAVRAFGLTGEVIVPSFTFIATAHALQWQEITPVFCDIERDNYTIDSAKVEELLTPRTTGIIGVHIWGRPCNTTALAEIARRNNLRLMFDASHAFGCSHRGQPIGGFGDAEVFSFHATKVVNSFEGGAIVTNNDEVAAKLRLMKNFGFVGTDKVASIGTNGKMTEICAAMGLTSFESMNEFRSINRENYKQYRRHLNSIPGVRVLAFDEDETPNYQYVVCELDQKTMGISRDILADILRAERVFARRYFYPGCHNMEPYRSYFPQARRMLPNTEDLMTKVLCFPTGTAVNSEIIERIGSLIHFAVSQSTAIQNKLTATAAMSTAGQVDEG